MIWFWLRLQGEEGGLDGGVFADHRPFSINDMSFSLSFTTAGNGQHLYASSFAGLMLRQSIERSQSGKETGSVDDRQFQLLSISQKIHPIVSQLFVWKMINL